MEIFKKFINKELRRRMLEHLKKSSHTDNDRHEPNRNKIIAHTHTKIKAVQESNNNKNYF